MYVVGDWSRFTCTCHMCPRSSPPHHHHLTQPATRSPSTEELVKRALNRTNTDSVLQSAAKITASAKRRGAGPAGGARHISQATGGGQGRDVASTAAALAALTVTSGGASSARGEAMAFSGGAMGGAMTPRRVTEEEYASLPSFTTSQVSLQDINNALRHLKALPSDRPGTDRVAR